MRLVRGWKNFPGELPAPVVTVGNFDGVHLGHQAVLRETARRARHARTCSLAFTFDPHPLRFLRPEESLPLLSTLSQKTQLIQALGIDLLLCATFDEEMFRLSPRQFVHDVLLDRLRMREIVEGSDFTFGHRRAGTIETLRRLGDERGFGVVVHREVRADGEVVSSSRIRGQIRSGRVEEAAKLLGRLYAIEGKVVEGNRRGKKLGFPTVNLAVENELLPQVGIYATIAEHGSGRYGGVTNVGYRPTFGEGVLTVETFILDFCREVYGEAISLHFVARLRDEMKFSDADALVRQMKLDVEQARQVLKESPAAAAGPGGPARPGTEDGGQRTDDRGQRAGDGGQRPEERGPLEHRGFPSDL